MVAGQDVDHVPAARPDVGVGDPERGRKRGEGCRHRGTPSLGVGARRVPGRRADQTGPGGGSFVNNCPFNGWLIGIFKEDPGLLAASIRTSTCLDVDPSLPHTVATAR